MSRRIYVFEIKIGVQEESEQKPEVLTVSDFPALVIRKRYFPLHLQALFEQTISQFASALMLKTVFVYTVVIFF